MATLDKRITALEQASPGDNLGPMFLRFVAPDTKDSEIQRITQGPQEWLRQPAESEQDLKNRALREVTPPPPRSCTMFLCD